MRMSQRHDRIACPHCESEYLKSVSLEVDQAKEKVSVMLDCRCAKCGHEWTAYGFLINDAVR